MIKCEKGVIQINGWGNEIDPEMGCLMQYFFENATEKETVVALETFKDGLTMKAKINFLSALAMVMQ